MKRAFTKWELLLLLAVLGIFACILFPIFARARENEEYGYCAKRLHHLGQSFQLYARDHDALYPPSRQSGLPLGWSDSLYPYVKNSIVFDCPATDSPAPTATQRTSYFMNTRLASLPTANLAAPFLTVLAGDSDAQMNAASPHYVIASIPPRWPKDARSPLYRHFEYSAFLFADGHAKLVKAKNAPGTESPSRGLPTFAPR